MSTHRTRLLALSGTAIALTLLSGCTGGDGDRPAAEPTTSSLAPSPSASPSSTPDPWAGYFDEQAASAGVGDFLWQSWGSFGDPGSVAPHRSENRTIDPGTYTVTLECAGPDAMTGRIAASSGTTVNDAVLVSCMASTPVPVDLPERGLLVDLDSAGEPGAFLIRVSRTQ